ncbi:hypothetical protein AA0119_g10978 [Alternaria tenuissima]|jgi:predicted GIY-YIG superfamily endonuclease|uniref:Bacteriophage T5 Orf172 DNA-binding domain-containing protein n=1 Tax=Alternaria tenuissima TaxID=119927 RepID=A0ABY0FXI3_9PLEO|nr:hypothetical protein AALT_g10336 [Alternaria alternata]RYN90842.1 hypothetical protein AA0119_g10978 [Alternaria tenuissima]RYO07101.1 hypothetical protein AA0121_g11784 [Alternaria tenuissima]
MARRGSLASSLTDQTAASVRRRNAGKRLSEPFRTPETSSTTNSRSPPTPGSTLGTPILIDSDDEKDSTPTKQKKSNIWSSQDNSATSSTLGLLEIPVRAKHLTSVSANEDAQDIKINEEITNEAQEDTSNYSQLIHAKLGTIVCETLLKSEGEGFLYVFRDPKHKGAVKIGYTRDINRRTKEHEKCELALVFVHISGRVKAMKRAEQLIKADLRHLRRPWKCSACKRTHEEWFEIDEEIAKARVTLWVDWINNCDPYDSHGNIKPFWRYLIEYGRNPREELDSKNHEARWRHWYWVLSEPLPSDIPGFQKHQRKSSGMRRRAMPSQWYKNEKVAPTHNQTITNVDGTSIEALQTLGISEFLHAATQTATNSSINWTLSINVQCDAYGDQEEPPVNGFSWE